MDLCKVTLIGNVGRDPELRYTQIGKPVLSFSVACNRMGPPSSDGGERDRITEWFTIICFNRLAETHGNIVTKGSRVYVDGRLQTRSYEGRDGQTRHVVEVVANEVILLSPRQRPDLAAGMGEAPVGAAAAAHGHGEHDSSLDDVPF